MLMMRSTHGGICRLGRLRDLVWFMKVQILNAMSRSNPTRSYAYRHAHPEIYLQL